MKKILIGLLVLLSGFNAINCMEEKEDNLEFFEALPAELRYSIIATMLEENINRWDDIFKFDRNSLKEILNKITLVSKDFVVLGKEELKKLIRKLKQHRFAYLQESIKDQYKGVSKEELNKKLTDLLKFSMDQDDAEESVRLTIAGADINSKNRGGWTALIWAAHKGHTEIVRLLIDNGTDIDGKDDYDGQTALMLVARYGHTEAVKLLIDKGVDINTKDHDGQTALMWAVHYGHTEIVRLLIDKDADIDSKNNYGSTALMVAAREEGRIEIVRLLIKKGANIDSEDNEGLTALMVAAVNGHTELVKLLSKD